MYTFGVIGLGPAGCFFLACLPSSLYRNTIVFDSGSVGGDLGTAWGGIVANLTRTELARAFHAVPRWSQLSLDILEKYDPDICPLLSDVALQLRELMIPILKEVTLHSQHITSSYQIAGGWRLMINGKNISFDVAKLIVCTGGEPRILNYPRPAIPLAVALEERQLADYIRPEDRVVVFGTAHSGTLILRNLHNIGCREIIGVYKGDVPFRWSRNHTIECPCHILGGTGCHDSEGLKQESAAIADTIVRGEWPEIRILRVDSEEFIKAIMTADYVVYATGFKSRIPQLYDMGGGVLGTQYNPKTAMIAPGAWGFGMAYPGIYEKPRGGEAPDIGLPGFIKHILACLDAVLDG